MKNNVWKKAAAVSLSLMIFGGALSAGVQAASVPKVSAYQNPSLTIVVDGKERTFYNAQGKEVHPLSYQGTTYLPVRAIGELMGKLVNWDNKNLTVSLLGKRTEAPTAGTPDTAAQPGYVSAELRKDFTIQVEQAVCTFRDANNTVVYPLLYQGSTYLPVRAIGELMGKKVGWQGDTKTVTLSQPDPDDSLVTDADSFKEMPGSQNSTLLSVEQAREKALAHAGLSASQVTFLQQKLEWDDGRYQYEIEFITKDSVEYDYEIDARTGEVVSFDKDVESYTPGTGGNSAGTMLSVDDAKEKALSHAGLTSSAVTFTKQKLDRDDGKYVYEISFYTRDYVEYEYEIDAYSGAVLSYEQDKEHLPSGGGTESGSAAITMDRAKEIALSKVPGAALSNIRKAELDRDDGRWIYEIEVVYSGMEHEFEIDGATGAVLSWDKERADR